MKSTKEEQEEGKRKKTIYIRERKEMGINGEGRGRG